MDSVEKSYRKKKIQQRYRRKHRKEIWQRTKKYREEHPEWWKNQQKKYREKNKEKTRLYRLDYKKNHHDRYKAIYEKKNKKRSKMRRWRRYRNKSLEVIVGVDCVICNKFTLGRAQKRFCDECYVLWQRSIPRRVMEEINKVSDFEKLPLYLIRWKRIMELRKVTYSAKELSYEGEVGWMKFRNNGQKNGEMLQGDELEKRLNVPEKTPLYMLERNDIWKGKS